MRRVYVIALTIALLLVVTATWLLKSRFGHYTELTFAIGTFASIFAFFGTAIQFAQGYEERHAERPGSEARRRRLLSYSLFTILGLSSSVLFIVAVVNLSELISDVSSEPASRDNVFYGIALPFLVVILFLALDYKVRAARMLDVQKEVLKEMGRIINSWSLPTDDIDQQREIDMAPSTNLLRSYELRLNALCEQALLAASSTGHQASNSVGLTAVLFLANEEKRHFVPVAVGGGTVNYRNALDTFRPPFFNRESFSKVYNKYHRVTIEERLRDDQIAQKLSQFRRDTKGYISSSGLIYAIERKLVFEDNLYTKCLAFRFEFLERLPQDERQLFQFQQLIGIPVTVFDRKVGVLLLMSPRPRTFYTKDKIYRLLGDLMGAALQFGIFRGLFEEKGFRDLFRNAPLLSTEEELKDIISFINQLAPDFSRPCQVTEERSVIHEKSA